MESFREAAYLTYKPDTKRDKKTLTYDLWFDYLGLRSGSLDEREMLRRAIKSHLGDTHYTFLRKIDNELAFTTLVSEFLERHGESFWGRRNRDHLSQPDPLKGFLCPRDARRPDSILVELIEKVFDWKATLTHRNQNRLPEEKRVVNDIDFKAMTGLAKDAPQAFPLAKRTPDFGKSAVQGQSASTNSQDSYVNDKVARSIASENLKSPTNLWQASSFFPLKLSICSSGRIKRACSRAVELLLLSCVCSFGQPIYLKKGPEEDLLTANLTMYCEQAKYLPVPRTRRKTQHDGYVDSIEVIDPDVDGSDPSLSKAIDPATESKVASQTEETYTKKPAFQATTPKSRQNLVSKLSPRSVEPPQSRNRQIEDQNSSMNGLSKEPTQRPPSSKTPKPRHQSPTNELSNEPVEEPPSSKKQKRDHSSEGQEPTNFPTTKPLPRGKKHTRDVSEGRGPIDFQTTMPLPSSKKHMRDISESREPTSLQTETSFSALTPRATSSAPSRHSPKAMRMDVDQELLLEDAIERTMFLVVDGVQKDILQVTVPLSSCGATSEQLFSALIEARNLSPEAARRVNFISATYTWNGKGQALRRGNADDWNRFCRKIDKAWETEKFDDECEIEMNVHVS